MKTRAATITTISAIIIISLSALSGCGQHKMESMHGMDMEKDTMSTPMEKPMMEESGKMMEEDAKMDGMDMDKSKGTM